MSIQSEIERIRGNVQDSLDVCRDAGVSVASGANSNALPSAVAELARSVGGVSLPPGYIQVEYLQSTGTQYINTGVLYGPDNYRNMRIVADSIVGTAANGWAVSGVGAGTTFYYGCGNSSRTMYYGNGSQDISSGADYTGNRAIWDINHQDAYYRVAEKASGKVLVDIGITLSTPTAGSHPLYLFAYRWTPGPSYDATCHNETIYGCKIYEGDALARNFVPCVNTSGAAGLYDLVNGVFYGNAGSGTFITGPVVGVTPIEKGGTGATDAATARNNLGITPQNIDALPLAGGNMTGAGPVQYPVVGDPGRSQHYISAGGGYSPNSGKYGVKLVCCDQPDCQTGMGQDLTGLPGGYELSIAGGRNAAGNTGYISFAMHSVNSKVYDRLGYFDNGGNFYTKGQITEGGTALSAKYAAKGEIPTDYLPKSGGTVSGVLNVTGGANISGRSAGGGDDEGLVIGRASNNYAGVCLGDPSGVRSVFYLMPDNSAKWRYVGSSGTGSDIAHPGKAGTIALTDDLHSANRIEDGTVGIMASNSNEISFKSNSNVIYFGYDNRFGAAVPVDTYRFGTHTGGGGAEKGKIVCGEVVENGTSLATKYALKSEIPTDYLPKSGGTLSGTLNGTAGIVLTSTVSSANNEQGLTLKNGTYTGRVSLGNSGGLGIYAGANIFLRPGTSEGSDFGVRMTKSDMTPTTSESMSLGTSSTKQYNNIYGKAIYQNGKQVANKDDIPSDYLPASGGTITGPVTLSGGDSATSGKLILDNAVGGQITNNGSSTLLGFATAGTSTFLVGAGSYVLNLRGSGSRPKFNNYDLARMSDLGRTTAVNAADTNYTTLMARGTSLHSSDTTPSVNGAICWTYK